MSIPMPLKKNYPVTVKRSKGELNVQRCHENENSSPVQVFYRREKNMQLDINANFLTKEAET
jgi:hypothetical protein